MEGLAIIGAVTLFILAAVFAFICYLLAREFKWAWIRMSRLARVLKGKNWRAWRRRKPRVFLAAVWKDMWSGYDTQEVRGIVLPRNVDEPIRRRHFYGA